MDSIYIIPIIFSTIVAFLIALMLIGYFVHNDEMDKMADFYCQKFEQKPKAISYFNNIMMGRIDEIRCEQYITKESLQNGYTCQENATCKKIKGEE